MIVHSAYRDPTSPSLFGKYKANDHATITEIDCSLAECPLRKIGCCTMAGVFGSKCPHGKWLNQTGPTKRSGKASSWVREHRTKDAPWLNSPPSKLAFLGDWVYLPYAHMSMCEAVPFLAHSKAFVTGQPFLAKEDWTKANILTLIRFRPHALFGNEIAVYQRDQVPLFMLHLYSLDRAMWNAVVEDAPEFNKPPNYIGRKAILKTLNAIIRITKVVHLSYPVVWEWDGVVARTKDISAYHDTWGGLKDGKVEITFEPSDKTAVVVESNDWVNDGTVFVD